MPPSAAKAVKSGQSGNLSELAYQRLLDMLISGEIKINSVLQERVLAEAMNTSRTPVREALSRLESEGLVKRHNGRVLTVTQISLQDYIHALNVRQLLEPEAAALAAGRIDPKRIRAILMSLEKLISSTSVTPGKRWAADDLVHGTIAEASGNPLLAGMIRDLRRRSHVFTMSSASASGGSLKGFADHLPLLEAIEAGDAERSRELMFSHLQNVKNAVVSQLLDGGAAN